MLENVSNNTINRNWCSECGGIGHGKKCKCKGDVAFVVGCCKTCGGDGMVNVKPPKDEKPKIWTP